MRRSGPDPSTMKRVPHIEFRSKRAFPRPETTHGPCSRKGLTGGQTGGPELRDPRGAAGDGDPREKNEGGRLGGTIRQHRGMRVSKGGGRASRAPGGIEHSKGGDGR